MGNEKQSGCLRPLIGAMLGGVVAPITALAVGFIDAPTVDPKDPLANEWYSPFVLIILPFFALVVGSIFGGVMGYAYSGTTSNAIKWALAALVVGLALGPVIPDGRGNFAARPMLHMFVIGVLVYAGFLYADEVSRKKPMPIKDLGD